MFLASRIITFAKSWQEHQYPQPNDNLLYPEPLRYDQKTPNPSKNKIMYVPNHLKWRILLAQELKLFYFERENSHRNCKRIFELYGRYLLGTTYDTFLNYLNQLKYEISDLKLPSYIIAAVALLEPLRIACERIRRRKANGSCSLLELAEEMLEVLRTKEREKAGSRYPATGFSAQTHRNEFNSGIPNAPRHAQLP